MALFSKKSATDAAPVADTESDAGGAYALDPNDTIDIDTLQNGGAVNGSNAAPVAVTNAPVKPSGLRGPIVGLNIGADSIKAVELQGRGSSVYVSALGSIPTPADSLSDGVVMNSMALARAIKQLWKEAGIKSRNVVSSVSGTSSLVVRVIEVPRMSDNELTDNMKVDLDRYIPFAPNEVRHSFVALRELPSDPDSPDMEVLLAAARNETIDQHIDVLDDSKLRPAAIDVEPLAAARSVIFAGNDDAPIVSSEYSTATALINIGALSTEISVLRGDVMVFTRTVPGGSGAFTQALADNLGLALAEADDAKQRLGDALEPTEEAAPAVSAQAPDDWSDFGAPAAADDATTTTIAIAPATNDPFDAGYFEQGPRQNEPGEQHQQKQDDATPENQDENTPPSNGDGTPAVPGSEPFGFDFNLLPAQEVDEADASTREAAPIIAKLPETPSEEGELEFPLQGAQVDEAAPVGQMIAFDAAEDPSLPSFPTLPYIESMEDDEDDEIKTLPTTQREEDEDEEPVEPQLEPIAFSFDAVPSVSASNELSDTANLPSAYDFPAANPTTPLPQVEAPAVATPAWTDASAVEAAAVPVETPTAAADDDIFDLDTLLQPAAGAAATTSAAPDPFAAPDVPPPVAAAAPDVDFGASLLDDDFGSAFGAGLGAADGSLNARGVYDVLKPLLDELIGEVRRSLEYYMSRYPDAPIERIVLIGGGAKLRNIDAAFTQALSIPTLVANPLAHLPVKAKNSARLVEEDGPIYAVALGLALRDLV